VGISFALSVSFFRIPIITVNKIPFHTPSQTPAKIQKLLPQDQLKSAAEIIRRNACQAQMWNEIRTNKYIEKFITNNLK